MISVVVGNTGPIPSSCKRVIDCNILQNAEIGCLKNSDNCLVVLKRSSSTAYFSSEMSSLLQNLHTITYNCIQETTHFGRKVSC